MIRINQIKLKPEFTTDPARLNTELEKKIGSALKLKGEEFTYQIVKKSVDSRKKPDIQIVYCVNVSLKNEGQENRIVKKINDNNIMLIKPVNYVIPEAKRPKDSLSPVIVGFGPAGMFCALYLAKLGYKPIVIERGEAVENRVQTVEGFWRGDKLNTESNAQFGEGGAGTFSDGKLNTQIKEVYGRISEVLKTFVSFGADSSILYEAKPHIGTDKLIDIVKNIRNEIISLGGEVRFNTKMTEVLVDKSNAVTGINFINTKTGELGKISCDSLVLAIGHSARDTFEFLKDILVMEQKAFAVGLRIQHKQELININEFGNGKYKNYMPASYKVTYKTEAGRGVYSFCMCPGGYVVNASSEEGRLAVNGMSYSKRDSDNANSAIIVTVDENDYGRDNVLAGMEFQRKLESAAYNICKGKIPVQRFEDFENNRETSEAALSVNSIKPCIKGSFSGANIRNIIPDTISKSIIEAVHGFDRQIKGFSDKDALLAGIESRTSSPVRIVRNEELMSNIHGIYPCGEGAGYAGGITSAAVDGIKVFEAIVSKY